MKFSMLRRFPSNGVGLLIPFSLNVSVGAEAFSVSFFGPSWPSVDMVSFVRSGSVSLGWCFYEDRQHEYRSASLLLRLRLCDDNDSRRIKQSRVTGIEFV